MPKTHTTGIERFISKKLSQKAGSIVVDEGAPLSERSDDGAVGRCEANMQPNYLLSLAIQA